MNKKVSFELTQEEYDAICKFWEQVKKSPMNSSQALNFDDFCKDIIVTCAKGPNLGEMFKDMNLEDLMNQMGDLSQLRDMFSGLKKEKNKTEPKKEEIPDDEKYKS